MPTQDYTCSNLTNLDTGHSLLFRHKTPVLYHRDQKKASLCRAQKQKTVPVQFKAWRHYEFSCWWWKMMEKKFPPSSTRFLGCLCKAILCFQVSLNTPHTSLATSLSACAQHHAPTNHTVIQQTCANFELQIEQNFQHGTCISMLSALHLQRSISSQSHINIL